MEEKVITYDYKNLRVSREMEAMWTDCYENLGWQVTGVAMTSPALSGVEINLKRDRKIKNKSELVKLQERMNLNLQRIERLLQAKRNAGTVEGISTGVVGTMTFGGGLSLLLTIPSTISLVCGIALGALGVGIGILGYFVFKKTKEKKLKKLDPELETEFDKLSELCEEANRLITE